MRFEFREPRLTAGRPEEAIQQIQGYLFEMRRALEEAMKTADAEIQQAKKDSAQEAQKIASSQRTPQSVFTQIKDLIIKSADVIEAVSQKTVIQLDGRYVAVSDFGTFREETGNRLEASDKAIEQNYSSIQQIESLVEGISDTQIEMNAYIRTGLLYEDENGVPRYGVEIGEQAEQDGALAFRKFARLSSQKLSFFDQNENEVAYISDRALHITEAEIQRLTGDTADFKRLRIGSYIIQESNDGHLTIM